MFKADFHIHTKYSFDCGMAPEDIVRRCRELGINCIAIADHGTAEGGLKVQSMAPFPVIVAEEILTEHGEVMGMFLKETVPSNIKLEDAIRRIKDQGGLVCVPHPFDTLRPSALGGKVLDSIVKDVDVIEVFNARAMFAKVNTRAKSFAAKHGIPGTAGSDSHSLGELGNAYIEMPDFSTKEQFLEALKQGRISGKTANPLVHFASVGSRIKKRFNR